MNTTVSRGVEGVAEGTREGTPDADRRSDPSPAVGGVEALANRDGDASPPDAAGTDRSVEMEAIAAQLSRISGSGESAMLPGGRDRSSGTAAPGSRPSSPSNPRAALREAVAEIARRQAALDRHGGSPSALASSLPLTAPLAGPVPRPHAAIDATAALRPRVHADPRRPGVGLSSEVSETFARFSRDLREAIQATDARPQVEALDRQVRQIGRAVGGTASGPSAADALARIGEQTQEMRDLLKAASDRSVPLDSIERHVTSLEARLGRLAALPASSTRQAGGAPPDDGASLDGLQPRSAHGADGPGSTDLIEGLSRRMDDIHASLRSQLAESAVDMRPLADLVRGLSDRIGQSRTASAEFQQLEVALRDTAMKIDGTEPGVDPRGVRAVETQIARLADRFDRSEASLKALDGVEHSLGELFSQFEVTRQVAIDAAETAARTAARDTLRAALQTPSFAQRPAEMPPAFVDQVVRGIDELRTLQETIERRTQTALSDILAVMERLALRMAADSAEVPRGGAERDPSPGQISRRRRAAVGPEPSGTPRLEIDPADLLIEPGSGRGTAALAGRTEVEGAVEAVDDEATPNAVALDGDGPSGFIAAARRAAQAAQASAAATAALKATDRRPLRPGSAQRQAGGAEPAAQGPLGRATALLRQRRRPVLLGLAALILLIGALEVVRLGGEPLVATRAGESELASPGRTRLAGLPVSPAAPIPAPSGGALPAPSAGPAPAPVASLPQPAAAPAAAPPSPALPMFVAGPARPAAPVEGIGEGLRSLASAGDAAAQYEVGLRYADGRGVVRDPKQAIGWFEKAAAQGLAPAQYRLGSAYEKGVGVDRDALLAMDWYGKAADAGNIRAMHNLAVMSAEGAAGKPDYTKAAQWFGKASAFGVRDSQFNLAILYARGLGIEQSLAQSYTWFAIAAGEGDEDAAKKRDEVAAKLDPKALTGAKAVADAYRAATPAAAANEVTPPSGGWDALAPRAPGASTPSAKVSQL